MAPRPGLGVDNLEPSDPCFLVLDSFVCLAFILHLALKYIVTQPLSHLTALSARVAAGDLSPANRGRTRRRAAGNPGGVLQPNDRSPGLKPGRDRADQPPAGGQSGGAVGAAGRADRPGPACRAASPLWVHWLPASPASSTTRSGIFPTFSRVTDGTGKLTADFLRRCCDHDLNAETQRAGRIVRRTRWTFHDRLRQTGFRPIWRWRYWKAP